MKLKQFIKKIKLIKRLVFGGLISANYTAFNINPEIKKTDDVMKVVKELSHKYTNLEDLLSDKIYKYLIEEGVILNAKMQHNLIPTSGFSVLTRLLTGDATYTGEMNYWALGSGSTAFTNASTQLNTEVGRGLLDSTSFADNIAYADAFIEAGDIADATYPEFAIFIDGGAGADTGQAWSLLITGGWVKSGSLYIAGQYSFTNA